MQQLDPAQLGTVRSDWTLSEAEAVHALPFNDLLFHAQRVHRQHFEPNKVQISTLLSIKTGGCPEDCAYCPQSVRYETGLARDELMEVADVVAAARAARESGATRFCMGAAYRSPKPRQLAVGVVHSGAIVGRSTDARARRGHAARAAPRSHRRSRGSGA